MRVLGSIRGKLFTLISATVGTLVAVLTWYLPTVQISSMDGGEES